jgi:hypothetical protein
MSRMKQIKPGGTIGLRLTPTERTLLLNAIHDLPDQITDVIRRTPTVQPILLTLKDLDELHGRVSGVANRTKDKRLQERLDAISAKIQKLLYRHQEVPEETDRPATVSFLDRFVEFLAEPGPRIAPLPAKSKKGEDQYGIKLTDKQRESLIHCTELSKGLRGKIQQVGAATQTLGFTRDELDELASEVDLAVFEARPPHKQRLAAVYDKLESLLDALEDDAANEPRQPLSHRTGTIYQFKVTLKDSDPPIWRRIQIPDCTLGELHDVLQIVMGWEDSHLHQFIIRGTCYGPRDPDDIDWDMETEDEEDILISQVTKMGRKVRFTYEYDFGDSWQHEIVLEKTLDLEPRVKYPRCVGGERACPPEDVGGVWGYAEFLAAIADPKHESHRDMKEWIGGRFDAEKFSVHAVNKDLRRIYVT